jgi:general secretion pathway protein I
MSDLRLRALAQWSAENRLAHLRIERLAPPRLPPVGKRSFDCPQADVALRCDEEVFATPNPSFVRVEISVVASLPDGTTTNRLARLVGFATNLP